MANKPIADYSEWETIVALGNCRATKAQANEHGDDPEEGKLIEHLKAFSKPGSDRMTKVENWRRLCKPENK